MSLAPIEAGALRQNKLTDHFFVAPTDRRLWDKVHKSRSLGLRRYINVIYWGLGSSAWVASKAFFIQRYLAEHVCDRLRIISFLLSSRPITVTQVTFSSSATFYRSTPSQYFSHWTIESRSSSSSLKVDDGVGSWVTWARGNVAGGRYGEWSDESE